MRKLSRLILTLSLFCLPLSGCPSGAKQEPKGKGAASDLYAGYRFDEPGSIDLGTQPLALPEGSVSELLPRDQVLARQLAAGGVRVVAHPFLKGRDLYQFMAQGRLEAGLLGDMPAITAAANGDVVIVAMVKQGVSSIVASKPMLVKELKGKRVATGLGSTAHFTLLNALENEGLSEQEVTLVGMELNEMPAALAEGRIDAFCAWEPTPSLALASHPEFRLVHRGLNYSFLCLRRDFAAAHPDQARQLAAAVVRGSNWMRIGGNLERVAGWTRASAAEFQRKPYLLKEEQMIAITRRDLLNIPAAPQIPERLLRENELLWKEFNFLRRAGKIPEGTEWSKVRSAFDLDLLRTVQSDRKGHLLDRFQYRGQDLRQGGE